MGSFSIFAVPGLGTHAYGTFRSPAPNSTEIWLRDFLHIHIPEIRVVLYGYPSKVDNAKSIEKIEDIASKMLDKLVHFRQDTSVCFSCAVFSSIEEPLL